MRPQLRRTLAIGLAMLVTAGLARALTPRLVALEPAATPNLETMFPSAFGRWRPDPAGVQVITNPEIEATLDRLYSAVLTRTYLDDSGARVMLAVAYGGNQGDSLRVHRPEVCYYAQGFEVVAAESAMLSVDGATLPVRRVVTRQRSRVEPVTYWITVGDRAVAGSFGEKMAQMRYGLTGAVPDGVLVRVSTIDRDVEAGFDLNAAFIGELLAAMDAPARSRVLGTLARAGGETGRHD